MCFICSFLWTITVKINWNRSDYVHKLHGVNSIHEHDLHCDNTIQRVIRLILIWYILYGIRYTDTWNVQNIIPDYAVVSNGVLYAMKYIFLKRWHVNCQRWKIKHLIMLFYVPNGVFNVMRLETLSDGKATHGPNGLTNSCFFFCLICLHGHHGNMNTIMICRIIRPRLSSD